MIDYEDAGSGTHSKAFLCSFWLILTSSERKGNPSYPKPPPSPNIYCSVRFIVHAPKVPSFVGLISLRFRWFPQDIMFERSQPSQGGTPSITLLVYMVGFCWLELCFLLYSCLYPFLLNWDRYQSIHAKLSRQSYHQANWSYVDPNQASCRFRLLSWSV